MLESAEPSGRWFKYQQTGIGKGPLGIKVALCSGLRKSRPEAQGAGTDLPEPERGSLVHLGRPHDAWTRDSQTHPGLAPPAGAKTHHKAIWISPNLTVRELRWPVRSCHSKVR